MRKIGLLLLTLFVFLSCNFVSAAREKMTREQVAAAIERFDGGILTLFYKKDFSGVYLGDLNLSRCNFSDCDLCNANFTGRCTNLYLTKFNDSLLDEADFSGVTLDKTKMMRIKAKKCKFVGSVLLRTNFIDAKLKEADFSDSIMERPHFLRAVLINAIFSRSTINGASFREAKLGSARLDELLASGVSFLDVRAEKAIFDDARLIDPDFSHSHLMHTSFRDADVYGVDKAAKFESTRMDHADISGIDAKGCLFDKTDFDHVKGLEDAYSFEGSSFVQSKYISRSKLRKAGRMGAGTLTTGVKNLRLASRLVGGALRVAGNAGANAAVYSSVDHVARGSGQSGVGGQGGGGGQFSTGGAVGSFAASACAGALGEVLSGYGHGGDLRPVLNRDGGDEVGQKVEFLLRKRECQGQRDEEIERLRAELDHEIDIGDQRLASAKETELKVKELSFELEKIRREKSYGQLVEEKRRIYKDIFYSVLALGAAGFASLHSLNSFVF